MSDDQPIGHDHDEHDHEHDEGAHEALPPANFLTVEDVLASARLVERTASICLRADLTAQSDRIMEELSTLVTANGEVLPDDEEASVDATSNASRARELMEQLQAVRREMRASMWHVRFRAMPSDEWSTFRRLHWPKGNKPDMTNFRAKIVAQCAIEPPISEAQFHQLRSKLTGAQIMTLSDTAYSACSAGGIDVPKSPSSWADLTQQ